MSGEAPLRIDSSFHVSTGCEDSSVRRASERLIRVLARRTGLTFSKINDGTGPALAVNCGRPMGGPPSLGEDESYTLTVTSRSATVDAPTAIGALHGMQTFLESVERTSPVSTVHDVTIHD